MMRKLFLGLLLAGCVQAETGGEIIQGIYNRGIYFDEKRFTVDVLLDFINDAQEMIAIIGRTNEEHYSTVLGAGSRMAMPAGFYQVEAVILNPDPNDANARRYTSLIYVPIKRLGRVGSHDSRPAEFSVWKDSLWLDVGSPGSTDTIGILYFSHATALADSSDTVDLPDQHIPLLIDVVRQMCFDRLEVPEMSPEEKALNLVKMIETALLGRPTDIQHVRTVEGP